MSNTGTIKWFSNAKGFGFIIPEGGEGDIFVHYSAINVEGYKTLKAGQAVTYEVQRGNKGLHATNIIPFDPGVEPEDDPLDSAEDSAVKTALVQSNSEAENKKTGADNQYRFFFIEPGW